MAVVFCFASVAYIAGENFTEEDKVDPDVEKLRQVLEAGILSFAEEDESLGAYHGVVTENSRILFTKHRSIFSWNSIKRDNKPFRKRLKYYDSNWKQIGSAVNLSSSPGNFTVPDDIGRRAKHFEFSHLDGGYQTNGARKARHGLI